jgi:hypothetical protein
MMEVMTPPVIQRWIEIIDSHSEDRLDELDDLLAEDAVFYSPAVFTPQEGRAKAAMYLKAAATLFGATNFHYLHHWYSDRSAVLEFEATVDAVYVNGVDIIHWNDDDKIVSFKVMMRPVKGLQAIMPKMAELLAP